MTNIGRTHVTSETLEMADIKPVGDYVLIKVFDPATTTKGGLILIRGAVGEG